ncbi:ABC transporter permease [Mobilitalea sibirica]|uniref:ABC transporter permease n=1 Tax=Mobilitalea sibirica TaxID=1462919 RepID=A0A8J7H217_9FIRM|nr:ABC transporter permease [Mobilitalea sibirica]MBH1940663.1 ABC transporter permease [Mobilitalea sibirica]
MLRLLRSDFYRLFRSKSLYICALVAGLLMIGSAYMVKWGSRVSEEIVFSYKDGLSYGLMAFNGGDVHLFMAIFISIFVTAEFTYGTMKNTVSKGFSKIMIYLSKFITACVASYFLILVMFVAGLVSGTLITGEVGSFTGSFALHALRMVGIELLLHAALSSILVMVAMIIRNGGGTMAVNIIAIVTVGPVIYQLLELFFDHRIEFTKYSLRNNVMLYNAIMAPPMEDILRSILVGICFLVVTLAIGILAFKNSDVK